MANLCLANRTVELREKTSLVIKPLNQGSSMRNIIISLPMSKAKLHSKKYTDEEYETLRAAFDSIDADGNGTLELDELHTFMNQTGMEESFADLVMFLFDGNHDGSITFDEFTSFLEAIEDLETNPHKFFHNVFNALDINKTGSIGASEMAEFGRLCGMPMSIEEAESAINEIDEDGNGTIEFEELCSALGI